MSVVKRYVVRLGGGDILLKTDDLCLALRVQLNTGNKVFDRVRRMRISNELARAMYVHRCRGGEDEEV